MAYKQLSIITQRWKNIKPPVGSQINWGHPLSQGLVGCWLMNEGGGKEAKSLLLNNQLTLKNNATWGINSKGTGIKTAGLSNYAVLMTPTSSLKPAVRVTIVWFGMFLGNMVNSTGNPRVASLEYNNTDSSPYVCYGIGRGQLDQDAIQFWWNNGGYQVTLIQNAIEYNVPIMFSLSINGKSAAKMYKNGVEIGKNTNVGTISYSSSSLLLVGSHFTAPTTNDSNCITNSIFIYNRALPPSEIRSLYENPYQFIQPIKRRFYFQVGAQATNRLTRRRVILSCS